MKLLLLYFLLGAIVAVWSAINQTQLESKNNTTNNAPSVSYFFAYVLIAMAWPVSVIVSIYSLLQGLLAKEL